MNTIVPATGWIPVSEATEKIAAFKAMHDLQNPETPIRKFKKSSYRWADPKDHSKGYLCRVMIEVLNGDIVEPVATARKSKKTESKKTETIAAKVEKKAKPEKKASDGVPADFKKRCAGMTVAELDFLANSIELETERGWDFMPARKRNANIRMARYAFDLMKEKKAAEANA